MPGSHLKKEIDVDAKQSPADSKFWHIFIFPGWMEINSVELAQYLWPVELMNTYAVSV